jgi:transposase
MVGAAGSLLFDPLLAWCRDRQLAKARGRQRTDSTPILAAVRALNRREVVGDTRRPALNTLAVAAPAGLRAVSGPDWQARYARRAEDERLPTPQAARAALTLTIGQGGWRLLAAVEHPDAPPRLREGPAIALLRRVWLRNYLGGGTQRRWREADNTPPAAQFVGSPYDRDAHDARQYATQWVGSNVHRTATCEGDLPHLSTPVGTRSGPAAAGAATPKIPAALQQRGVCPGPRIVDAGVLDAELLVERQDRYGIALRGPARLDEHGQARAGVGVEAQHFPIAGDRRQATRPAGKTGTGWTPAVGHRGHPVSQVKFSSRDWRRGALIAHGLRSPTRYPRRTLTIRPQPY